VKNNIINLEGGKIIFFWSPILCGEKNSKRQPPKTSSQSSEMIKKNVLFPIDWEICLKKGRGKKFFPL